MLTRSESGCDVGSVSSLARAVLIADSEPEPTGFLATLIVCAGFEPIMVTGLEVAAQARCLLPALIVVDAQLQDADLADLLHAIRHGDHTADIPLVVVSARDYESDRITALQLGAHYVPKLQTPALLAKVADILQTAESERPL